MTVAAKLNRVLFHHNRGRVARLAGITPQALSNITCGHAAPTLATLRKLASVLGVDFAWLVDDAQQWPPVRVPARVDEVELERLGAHAA